MNIQDIIPTIESIVEEIIDQGKVQLTEFSSSQDVDGWDSLVNIQIVVSVERHYGIRFDSDEISTWKNIGEMAQSVIQKCN